MSATGPLLNHDVVRSHLLRGMNEELAKIAEPIVQEAIAKATIQIERAMRQKMGQMLIGVIEQNFSIEKYGADLRIVVEQAMGKAGP